MPSWRRSPGCSGWPAWCCSATATPACPGWPSGAHRRALAATDALLLARRVAELADVEGADTVVHDDEQGIYGHPDHRAAARIGATAAELVGATGYAMTIDREHLHVVARDRHLVHGAARAAAVDYGRVTAEIALAVTGSAADLEHKRAAILAHASQVGPDDVPAETFAGDLRLRVVPPLRRPGRARPPRQRPPRRRLTARTPFRSVEQRRPCRRTRGT